MKSAASIETITPQDVQVGAPDHGVPDPNIPCIEVVFFAGATGPEQFLLGKAMRITASMAVELGEHLAKEGRRVRSGIVVANGHPHPAQG